MLRIAIVEDEKVEADQIKEFIARFQAENYTEFEVRHYADAISFLQSGTVVFDIVLMDIQMPHMNGMDAARTLREQDSRTVIIFLTNLAQFAVKGYEVEALDFIVKPVSYPVFEIKLKRAVKVAESNAMHTINVVRSGNVSRIPVRDVVYIEVSGHEIRYHIGAGIVKDWGVLGEVEKHLGPYHFMRCNNCYLVNPQHIREVSGYTIIMNNGDNLQISHPKKKAFMAALAQWMGEGKP